MPDGRSDSDATLTAKRGAYEQYIRSSPIWKAKRQERLELDGHCCRKCKSTGNGKPLHVHHRTYKHLFDEPMGDLVTLCENCHDLLHELHKRQNISLYKSTAGFLEEVVLVKEKRRRRNQPEDFLQAQRAVGRKGWYLKRMTKPGVKPVKYQLHSKKQGRAFIVNSDAMTTTEICRRYGEKAKS